MRPQAGEADMRKRTQAAARRGRRARHGESVSAPAGTSTGGDLTAGIGSLRPRGCLFEPGGLGVLRCRRGAFVGPQGHAGDGARPGRPGPQRGAGAGLRFGGRKQASRKQREARSQADEERGALRDQSKRDSGGARSDARVQGAATRRGGGARRSGRRVGGLSGRGRHGGVAMAAGPGPSGWLAAIGKLVGITAEHP